MQVVVAPPPPSCGCSAAPPPAASPPAPLVSPDGTSFYAPQSLPSLLATLSSLYSRHPASAISIVSGHTGSGVSKYYNGTAPYNRPLNTPHLVSTHAVPALSHITVDGTTANHSTTVSAGVTLASLVSHFASSSNPSHLALARHISHVANTQVRSAGTWAGNLALAAQYSTFPSDVALSFAALDARLSFYCAPPPNSPPDAPLPLLTNVPVLTYISSPSLQASCVLLLSATFPPAPPLPPNTVPLARRFKQTQRARNAHAVRSSPTLTLKRTSPKR